MHEERQTLQSSENIKIQRDFKSDGEESKIGKPFILLFVFSIFAIVVLFYLSRPPKDSQVTAVVQLQSSLLEDLIANIGSLTSKINQGGQTTAPVYPIKDKPQGENQLVSFEDVVELVRQHQAWLDQLGYAQEGNSGQLKTEQKSYYDTISKYEAPVVCEIGFNIGHSALLILAMKPTTQYIGFSLDILYSRRVYDALKPIFGERLQVIWGDSTKSVPKAHPMKCDVIIVDGGHSYEVAIADLNNMRRFSKATTDLFMDDLTCTAGWCEGPNKAWAEGKQKNIVKEEGCDSVGAHRGWCWGKYL